MYKLYTQVSVFRVIYQTRKKRKEIVIAVITGKNLTSHFSSNASSSRVGPFVTLERLKWKIKKEETRTLA